VRIISSGANGEVNGMKKFRKTAEGSRSLILFWKTQLEIVTFGECSPKTGGAIRAWLFAKIEFVTTV
jgi:hypothetical protein